MAKVAYVAPTNITIDPSTGKAVSSGKVYFGTADLDPSVLANRITVEVIQEDGTVVQIPPASQPLTMTAGVIIYQGSPVNVLIDGIYSLKITDSVGGQLYYVPRKNETAISTVETGVIPVNGSFEADTAVTGQPDNWTIVTGLNGTIAIDTDSAHGLKSLNFTSTDATGGGTATSSRFNVLAGGNVGVRYSYKSTSVDTLNKIDINWYNSANALISSSSVLNDGATNPASYTDMVTSVAAPATAKTGEIVITGMDGTGTTTIGSSYFDGFDLDINDAGVSRDGTEKLTNKTMKSPVIDSASYAGTQTNFKGDVEGNLTGNADTATLATTATTALNVSGTGVVDGNNILNNSVSISTNGEKLFDSLSDIVTASGTGSIPAGFFYVEGAYQNGAGTQTLEVQEKSSIDGVWDTIATVSTVNGAWVKFSPPLLIIHDGNSLRFENKGGGSTTTVKYRREFT